MTAYLVLASLAVLLALLLSGRFKPASLFVSWAVGYHLLIGTDEKSFLASYVNPGVVTLALLLMVSLVLERAPLLDALPARLLRGRPTFAVLRLTGFTAIASAFINNTAIVAALLGTLARQRHLPPSRVLLPLSYAAILGGITTLIGTSTNLVVNAFAVEAGLPPMGMFDLAWAGVPIAVVCLIVLAIGSRYLPLHQGRAEEQAQRYFLEARVMPGAPLVGRTIEQNRLRQLDGLYLVEIVRKGHLISPASPSELLQADDRLIFTGEIAKVSTLQRFPGLQLFGHQSGALLHSNLVEVVITGESELDGRTLRDLDFRTMFDAGVVGIRRGNQQLSGQLGRIVLHAGDCLLLATGADFGQHRNLDRNFVIVSGAPVRPRLSPRQSLLAFAGFFAVIVLAALERLPLLPGLLMLTGLFIASGLLEVAEMRRRFPFELVLIIGSALSIARVMEDSGAAGLIVQSMSAVSAGHGVWGAFIGAYLITLLLTEVLTNNAAAALGFPIALAAARAFDADPTPFIMIVCYGASAGFLVPFGYQTHLMVFSTGHYRAMDFVRLGLPITLAYSTVALTVVPYLFPLYP